MTSVRAASVRTLVSVVERGCSLNDALTDAAPPLHRELVYGVTRWYWQLKDRALKLLNTPMKRKDADIMLLILVGIYQLNELRVPPHAAINETVEACEELGKGWAKGLVNAVLRGYTRRQWESDRGETDEARYSHPAWMVDRFRRAWPEHWPQMLRANNERPPMVLRINRRRADRDGYLERLVQCGIPGAEDPHSPEGVVLRAAVPVSELPGFREGLVSVQDTAAQWAAHVLPVAAGDRVLDACAAPGGKLAHILELYPEAGEVVAIDIDAGRVRMVRDNLDRLGLSARVMAADAAEVDSWWSGMPFECILIDAPCSGSGVIRRRPDIKHLRRSGDTAQFVRKQSALLDRLWQTLAPHGHLLYITCSVFPEENEQQVERFVSSRDDVEIRAAGLPLGMDLGCGMQTLPGLHGVDGFYYSLMRKAEARARKPE